MYNNKHREGGEGESGGVRERKGKIERKIKIPQLSGLVEARLIKQFFVN